MTFHFEPLSRPSGPPVNGLLGNGVNVLSGDSYGSRVALHAIPLVDGSSVRHYGREISLPTFDPKAGLPSKTSVNTARLPKL